jgi:hypothetical protein
MSLARDRWIPLAEIAEREGGIKPASLRRIAEEQQRPSSRRYTRRTLRRWPPFEKNPSGHWGIKESRYQVWLAARQGVKR